MRADVVKPVKEPRFDWEGKAFECDCAHKAHYEFEAHDIRDRSAKFQHTMQGGHRIRKECPACGKETAWWTEVKDG